MKRVSAIFVTGLLVSALIAVGASEAKKSTPKAGKYAGEVKSIRGVGQFIDFTYKKNKNGKGKLTGLAAFFPIACSGNGFDVWFGAKRSGVNLKAPVAKSGKISTVTDTVNLQDPEMNIFKAQPADMRMTLEGKITGTRAKGTWNASSTNGFPCSGQGTWEADKRK